MRRSVVINWQPSSYFGWGVYGLNLALAWAADPDVEPIFSRPVISSSLALDPLRWARFGPILARSATFQAQLARFQEGSATIDLPVLVSLGGNFRPMRAAQDVALTGRPMIGVTFFERANLQPDEVEQARAYDMVVTGSTWNERILRAQGVERVRTVLQGVDPTLFRPGPRMEVLPGRFLVFSGGKLERRKGQDIVVAAFRKFAARRPDALLVTAWHSQFAGLAPSVDESGLAAPLPIDAKGRPDVQGWAAANGIPAANVLDLGQPANGMMPQLLREMDVAVFPNRGEGGTNLVAMECMACGVPTILSRNTGHLDLIEDGNSYTLDRQGQVGGLGAGFGEVEGWGESDVDEVVDRLEQVYLDRPAAQARGARGAETLARLSWSRAAREMKDLVLSTRKAAEAQKV